MRESLRPLKNKLFDGINFYLNEEDNVEVATFQYKNPGQDVPGSEMGSMYDIIIMQVDPPKLPERFKAILISPLDYVSRMIDDGFLGVVARATTTSDPVMDKALESLTQTAAEYIEEYGEDDV